MDILKNQSVKVFVTLLDSSMASPGLSRCITRPTFQMLGIFALFTGRFMVSVRYLGAIGAKWCRRIGAILSEPSAVLLGLFTGRFMVSVRYLSAFGLD